MLVSHIRGELHVPTYRDTNIIDGDRWVADAVADLEQSGALGVYGVGGSGNMGLMVLPLLGEASDAVVHLPFDCHGFCVCVKLLKTDTRAL